MITIQQHNIGDLEFDLTNKIVHDGSSYYETSNFINHKQPLGQYRTIENYLTLSTNKLADIYTLQEVQEPQDWPINSDSLDLETSILQPKNTNHQVKLEEKRVFKIQQGHNSIKSKINLTNSIEGKNRDKKAKGNGIEMTYIYNRTGSNTYVDLNEENQRRILHGCAVVFNTSIFKQMPKNTILPNIKLESNKRTSRWVFLQHRMTRKLLAIISVHGKIISPYGFIKYESPLVHYQTHWTTPPNTRQYPNDPNQRALPIYQALMNDINTLKTNIPNIQIIINGDFNLNLFSPTINPRGDENNPEKREMILFNQEQYLEEKKAEILHVIQELQFKLYAYQISIIPNIIPTEVTLPFPIDFMIIDNIFQFSNFYQELGINPEIDRIWLVNDFDHNKLIYQCQV